MQVRHPAKKDERIYIAGYELYKKHSGTDAGLERTSLSLMDKQHRFVMIDTETKPKLIFGIPVGRTAPKQMQRYQLHNHLGSAALELDGAAQVISYEEYHPFGTTAYQAKNLNIKAAAKRYRYTGMERDEESGLEYHSARYYLPWLGRWISTDPKGLVDGTNLYAYVRQNPLRLSDQEGREAKTTYLGSSRDEKYVGRLEKTWSGNQYWSESGSHNAGWYVRTEGREILAPPQTLPRFKLDSATLDLESSSLGWKRAPINLLDTQLTIKKPLSFETMQLEPSTTKCAMPPAPTDPYKATWFLISDYEQKGSEAASRGQESGQVGNDVNERYLSWNFAREDYRKVNLKGGDPILRNAEHYLFRKWTASEKDNAFVKIPDGLPFMDPGKWNPTLMMNAGVMGGIHDPLYNWLRTHILEHLININKTTPDMYFFEQAGYEAGEHQWKEYD